MSQSITKIPLASLQTPSNIPSIIQGVSSQETEETVHGRSLEIGPRVSPQVTPDNSDSDFRKSKPSPTD